MIAMESNDTNQMLNSIVDTLDACIEEGVNKDKLTTFDVEYMFTKLRAKSVGETSKVGVACTECKESNEVVINVDEIQVDVPKLDNMIDIGGDIVIEMKWPSYSDIIKLSGDGNATDQAFAVLRASLSAIHTNDERVDLQDESEKEVQDFIESMSRSQFELIQKFVEKMPTLSHDIEFKCTSCDKDNKVLLEGMQSFF